MDALSLEDCKLEFKLPNGEVFQIDLMDAEILLEDAEKQSKDSEGKFDYNSLGPNLKHLLKETVKVELSTTQAFSFAHKVRQAFLDHKKKFVTESQSDSGSN